MGNSVNNKESLNIPIMMLTIIGAVLIVFGFLLCKNNQFRMQVISTDGIVSGIQTATDSDGNVVRKSYTINYKANRSDYTATFDSLDLNLQMGDKYTLYYDLFEPTSVRNKRNGYIGYLALLLGVIFVLKCGPRFYKIVRDNYF